MMTRWAIVVALGLGSLGLVACGGDDDDDDASDPGTETTQPDDGDSSSGGGEYVIQSIAYTDVTAAAGSTLDISNQSGAPHTFTADDDSFDVDIEADNAATLDVPAEPGEYPFHCNIHSSMTATLTVE